MWTAPGKTWLSVNTVKPFESWVTLYSGAWSTASSGLWLYIIMRNKNLLKNLSGGGRTIINAIKESHPTCCQLYPYLEGDGGIVFSNWVGSCVGVNSVEDSRQDSWVWSEFSSLKRKQSVNIWRKKHSPQEDARSGALNLQTVGGSCFVIWRPCSTSFFLNNYINY